MAKMMTGKLRVDFLMMNMILFIYEYVVKKMKGLFCRCEGRLNLIFEDLLIYLRTYLDGFF